jgi:hypothetical protein
MVDLVRFDGALCGYLGWVDRESVFVEASLDHLGVGEWREMPNCFGQFGGAAVT